MNVITVDIKIKNLDQYSALLDQLKDIVEKIENFKFEIIQSKQMD